MRTTLATRLLSSTLLALGLSSAAWAADALKLDVYNPGTDALFPASSVLVSGQHEAVLIDAQFGNSQAEQVVQKIRASGKKLTTIYISHGDPDFYFGLETIKRAYPDAKVVATAHTIAHIEQTAAHKLSFWGPKLGKDAPSRTFLPERLQGDTLKVDGQTLKIMGLQGAQPERSYVWIPSIKAVVGGVVLYNNQHVWMADTQSRQARADWLTTLAEIERLQPKTVVPGHFLPGQYSNLQAARFTADYLRAFEAEAAKAKDSAALIAAMQQRYPKLAEESSLTLSAKVVKGEMKW